MIALALPIILPVGSIILFLVLAWLGLRLVARTGERSYAWLTVALVIWPAICSALNAAASIAIRSPKQSIHIFPYELTSAMGITVGLTTEIIGTAENFIGTALLVAAVWSMGRMKLQPRVRQAA